jgi:hypothetical protein
VGIQAEHSEGPLSDQPPTSDPKPLWEEDWGKFYEACSVFKPIWSEVHKPNPEWPESYVLSGNKLYFKNRLCVPTGLQIKVLYEYHRFLGHVGADKLWEYASQRAQWAQFGEARKLSASLVKYCETCQACSRPPSLKGPIEYTPIPLNPMSSVALDIFHMPQVKFQGNPYDCMVVCVDRHSGWIVAIPQLYKGLTGSKCAKDMYTQFWRPFGVPTTITSDQGSHFVSVWWKDMCALMGIRIAYSQAYHHQSNGRAEVAGQQLRERLRKLYISENLKLGRGPSPSN